MKTQIRKQVRRWGWLLLACMMLLSSDAVAGLYGAGVPAAAANGLYHAEEEFKKLPPECQSFLGSPAALKDLAQADTGTMNTIVKGQFLKRVSEIREHQTVQNGLPAEVRQALQDQRNKLLEAEYE